VILTSIGFAIASATASAGAAARLRPSTELWAPRHGDAARIRHRVVRIADSIELLNSDPGNRAPEIEAEVRRLGKLAESFET
jgi:hypothetical protein